MSTRERRDRSNRIDRELSLLFANSLAKNSLLTDSIALAAVGGYGRGELSPGSDIDITIVHDGKIKNLEAFVNDLLYPLWSGGIAVDHSVRTLTELAEVAEADVRVILGLLDLRYLCGNPDLISDAQNISLRLWQKLIKRYLPLIKDRKSTRLNSSH